MHDEPNEPSHCNATVLELRVPEEADRGVVSLAIEVELRQVERVVVANRWIQAEGQLLEPFLRLSIAPICDEFRRGRATI